MSITEDLADKLAIDVIAAMETLGDDRLPDEVAAVIGATSPTTEEAFRTAVRVRIAEQRARKFLTEKLGNLAE
ncbi:hypothetical protein HJ526_05025 [Donghicola sp. C2-DW-16]|uniref:Uncharacterized protein n=1 Tax=Donghicola mangrovi TaxID=2729614 RepID=A0ABX2PBC5_9RHOB|nr:hypothetical protein [Donghicola mangrovi]NVO26771.1 hypothetical protein [Donghicola mangrovi]